MHMLYMRGAEEAENAAKLVPDAAKCPVSALFGWKGKCVWRSKHTKTDAFFTDGVRASLFYNYML